MALLTSEKILKLIPSLFETDLNSERHLFKNFEKILAFDEGFIYYANPDSLQLKHTYKKHANYEKEVTFNLNTKLKKFIFSKNGEITDEASDLVKTIELEGTSQKSYIVSKISIKSTVFGIVVLSKREKNFYKQEDLDALDAVS